MTRRITVPDDHVALIISLELANELMGLCNLRRQQLWKKIERAKRAAIEPESDEVGEYSICGDIMLAILEAQGA